MCGDLGNILSFEAFNLKGIGKKIADNPLRLFYGAGDPASTKVWNKVLGRNDEALVDQWGGASSDTYTKAEAAGIDTGPGRAMHNVAKVIASSFAGGYAKEALGGSGLTGSALSSAEGPAGVSSGTGSLAGSGGGSGWGGLSAGQWTKIGGEALQGLSSFQAGQDNASSLRGDAGSERAAAALQAKNILKQASKLRSSARAATAASGVRVDEFSMPNEQDIAQAGETDAAMALLSGERRARALEAAAKQQSQGGMFGGLSSLFNIGSAIGSNWKNIAGG